MKYELHKDIMYIDCEVCGFESQCFCPLGGNYSEQVIQAAKAEGCEAIKNPNGSFLFKCPKGHEAIMLPTEIKFRKRYQYPKLKNERT